MLLLSAKAMTYLHTENVSAHCILVADLQRLPHADTWCRYAGIMITMRNSGFTHSLGKVTVCFLSLGQNCAFEAHLLITPIYCTLSHVMGQSHGG